MYLTLRIVSESSQLPLARHALNPLALVGKKAELGAILDCRARLRRPQHEMSHVVADDGIARKLK